MSFFKTWYDVHLLKKFPASLDLECSLPCSQKSITGSYPKPVWSTPSHPPFQRSMLILTSQLYLSLRSGNVPLRFSTTLCIHLSPPPGMLHILPISSPSDLVSPGITGAVINNNYFKYCLQLLLL